MKDDQDPTILSEESSIDQESAEVTLENNGVRRGSPETFPLEAPERTLPFDGTSPAGPAVEATQSFDRTEVPPGVAETLIERHVVVDQTVDFGSGPTIDMADGLAATELVPPKGGRYYGETLDSHQANQTTEYVDRTGQPPGRPAPGSKAGVRGGPSLPGYKLLAEIGRGGMGVVYKAWHERLDRPVALKMILSGAHASSEQLERFQIEAQAVAQIQDPGIVQIYDVGEHEGLPYFSLEFVAGGSLDKKIGGRPQPAREAAEMVRKLALAIHQAHLRKIIHRDLKPANVLLTPEGEPKITDFGLAKRMEVDSHQTRSGAIMGTPSYMAPEQAWGQTREIGTHTDQYALGTILYEMLVGHVPFQGATALETLELARTQEPIPPTRLQPKIPVDLETICLKCLQKEPSKRYADVATLAQELERFCEGKPILARPIGKTERAVRWCRRNPRVAGLIAAVAFSLVMVAGVSTYSAVRLTTLNTNLEKSIDAEKVAKKDAQEKQIQALAAKDKAEKSEAIARAARQKADEERAKAVEARIRAEKGVRGAVTQNRSSLNSLRNLSILANQRLAPIEGTREIREELIKTAMNDIQTSMKTMKELSGILEDREGMLLEKRTLVGVYQRAGKLAEETERFDEANKYFQEMDKRAVELVEMAPGDLAYLNILAISKGTLGGFQLDRIGDGRAALALFEETLKLRRQVLDRIPKDDDAKGGVCNALGAIGRSYLKLGDPAKAREIYREEGQLRDQFAPAYASKLEVRRERAGFEEKLGDVCLDLNDFAGARTCYDRSLELRKVLAENHTEETQTRRDVMLSTRKIATLDLFEGDPDRALKGYQSSLDDSRQRLKAYFNNPFVEPDLWVKQDVANCEYFVASAYLRLKDFKAAREHFQASLDVVATLSNDPRLKLNTIDLMLLKARCGDHVEASKIARELIVKPPLDSRIYYTAACGFSLCAGSLADLPASAENETLARQYTEGALKALRLAQGAGWRSPGLLLHDPELDPIRPDPGFIALLKEFQANPAP